MTLVKNIELINIYTTAFQSNLQDLIKSNKISSG